MISAVNLIYHLVTLLSVCLQWEHLTRRQAHNSVLLIGCHMVHRLSWASLAENHKSLSLHQYLPFAPPPALAFTVCCMDLTSWFPYVSEVMWCFSFLCLADFTLHSTFWVQPLYCKQQDSLFVIHTSFLCVCIYTLHNFCVCVCVYVCMNLCVHRLEDNLGCIPQECSLLLCDRVYHGLEDTN